jgi:hypothetical protein
MKMIGCNGNERGAAPLVQMIGWKRESNCGA